MIYLATIRLNSKAKNKEFPSIQILIAHDIDLKT